MKNYSIITLQKTIVIAGQLLLDYALTNALFNFHYIIS